MTKRPKFALWANTEINSLLQCIKKRTWRTKFQNYQIGVANFPMKLLFLTLVVVNRYLFQWHEFVQLCLQRLKWKHGQNVREFYALGLDDQCTMVLLVKEKLVPKSLKFKAIGGGGPGSNFRFLAFNTILSWLYPFQNELTCLSILNGCRDMKRRSWPLRARFRQFV